MDMQGTRALAVTQQQAWDGLNDPEVLKACIPGCDRLEATGENQYAVGMALKIGPVAAKFSGKVQLSEIQAPDSYRIAFDGQGGAAGFGKGQSQVRLSPASEGAGCVLDYTVKAQVGGKIAQVGQRLIDGVAKSMAEDFFKRFEAEMQRRHPAEAPPPSSQPSASPGPEGAAQSAASGAGRRLPTAWILLAVAVAGGALYLLVK